MFSTEKGFIRYLEGKMSPYKLNEKGKSTARQLFNGFSCDLLKEATEISFLQYLRFDEEGVPTEESVGMCFQKIGGIAHNKTLNPVDAAISHILAIGQKAYGYWNDYSARDTIRTYIAALRKAGFSDAEIADDLEKEVVPLVKNSANWSAWRTRMDGWTEDILSWNAEDIIEQNQSIIPDELYSGTRGYIEKISMQINASYEKNLFDCCAVMLRRLMEVLLVLSFQKNGIEDLIMDKGKAHHVSLEKMINIASSYNYSIKNDDLGQIILSFAHQQPGTSRSGKKKIFDTPATYDKIFKVNYDRDPQKKKFIKDIVDLDSRYSEIEKKYKTSGLNPIQTEVLKNGKQTIFALMGVCYRLANGDITEADIINNPKSIATIPFAYGEILSNYHKDDIDEKLDRIIKDIVIIVADAYQNAFNNGQTTSVSNFMKTDLRYYNDIVSKFAQALSMLIGEELKTCIDIFKRA